MPKDQKKQKKNYKDQDFTPYGKDEFEEEARLTIHTRFSITPGQF